MKTLENRADVEFLVNSFYEKVLKDDLIGFFFNDVVKLDFAVHMPTMHDFWESTLFGLAKYKGNPMIKHIHLNQKAKLEPQHFERWLQLWEETVYENFSGEMADQAVNKAKQIGQLMQFKVSRQGL